ncbi:MAG: hypothetical protein KDA21_02690 [Phycisphaerales bacterium]|nr:hypothetical protein [Phycisphaerales bacterium]
MKIRGADIARCAMTAVIAAACIVAPGCASVETTQTQPGIRETIHYLEIVTPQVDETCRALAAARGVTFGPPIAELGNARTADLPEGGAIGVRAPMRGTEEPVVRPYVLVNDINAALKAAEAAGGTVALPPMEIPGRGTCAIYILGGNQHGLWQR